MRQHIFFDCQGDDCAGSIDLPPTDTEPAKTGLIIISGGNELRSGAHGGQASLASAIAQAGHPVFRYDRRGIADSSGKNGGFESSANDIAAAVQAFRKSAPDIERIVAFGNCDAASALALFHGGLDLHGIIIANPWVIESSADQLNVEGGAATPNSAAIRARYWNRLKNPRSTIDLFTGKINLRKLAGGIFKAAKKDAPSALSQRMAASLTACDLPISILISRRDSTAMAFMAAWHDSGFSQLRARANINLSTADSASHSFADAAAKKWLHREILARL